MLWRHPMTIQKFFLRTSIVLFCAMFLPSTPAEAQPQGLDIGKARLWLAFNPKPRTPGRYYIRGVIDDNDTRDLVADLLTNTVTVRVQDSGDFDHTTTLQACRRTSEAVYCQSDATGFRTKAFVKRWKNLPNIWRLNVRVKDLTEAETGFGPLDPPLTITVTHGARVRTDVVAQTGGNEGDCKLKKGGTRLRCN